MKYAKHTRGEADAHRNDAAAYSRYSYDPEGARDRGHAEAAGTFVHTPASSAGQHEAPKRSAVPESYAAAYRAATSQTPAPAYQAAADGQFPGFESLNNAKEHTGRKVVLGIVGALLLAVLVAVGVVWIQVTKYMHDLDAILEEGQPPMTTSVLTPAEDGKPFYMLVVGLDTRELGNLGPGTYSDAIMLVRVDMSNKQVTTVSIPRDTRWTMPDGTVEKINAAYFYGGVDDCVQAVEQKTGVKISHVMVFDVSDMEEIVDAIGGVEINVEVPMRKEIIGTDQVVTLEPGLQTLSGIEAEVYTRDRFAYETDQDANRQSNIRTLMQAVITKVTKSPKAELPNVLMNLAPYLHTDLRAIDIMKLGWQYLWSPAEALTFYSGTAPSAGDIDPWYDSRWYCYENPQGWEELMSVVESGGDPSNLDLSGTTITHEERSKAEGIVEEYSEEE